MDTRIARANIGDIDAIDAIAYPFRNGKNPQLTFTRKDVLRRAVLLRELHVAYCENEIVGFVYFHERRDGWVTLHDLAVKESHQGKGIGRMLLYSVPCPFTLSTTQDNERANHFYRQAGMRFVRSYKGTVRMLNEYEMLILNCIVRGGNKDIPDIARQTGNAYGVQYVKPAFAWPFMVDSDPEHCDWPKMMQAVNLYHPVQALTMDYFPGQRDMMLAQVEDLRNAGVLRVAVCPKFDGAVKDIPQDCVVAISLKTVGRLAKQRNKYAGFIPDLWELVDRRCHLLGGSPDLQKQMITRLRGVGAKVLSLDGNAHIRSAGLGSVYHDGKWRRKRGEKADLAAGGLYSSGNIQRELQAAAEWVQPLLFTS